MTVQANKRVLHSSDILGTATPGAALIGLRIGGVQVACITFNRDCQLGIITKRNSEHILRTDFSSIIRSYGVQSRN
jgi:membrane protease subunit (stomatin/prohibitin family)